MKNKLQTWVDELMAANAARVMTPRETVRESHPQVAKDLRGAARRAERFMALSMGKVAE